MTPKPHRRQVKAQALLDSGNCYRTAISPAMAESLGIHAGDLQPLADPVKLCTADESKTLAVLGEVPDDITFKVPETGRRFKLRPIVIEGLASGINIGGPLMAAAGWKLDPAQGCATDRYGGHMTLRTSRGPQQGVALEGIRVAELTEEEDRHLVKDDSAKVLVHETVIVPGRSTKLIKLHAANKTKGWRGGAREAHLIDSDEADNFMEQTDLHPGLSAVLRFDKDGMTWAAVQNSRREAITVPAGTAYGVAELCRVPRPDNKDDKAKEDLKAEMRSKAFSKYTPDQQREFLVRCFRLDESPFLTDEKELWKAAEFLRGYWKHFAFDGNYGVTSLLEHQIELKEGSQPVKCRLAKEIYLTHRSKPKPTSIAAGTDPLPWDWKSRAGSRSRSG